MQLNPTPESSYVKLRSVAQKELNTLEEEFRSKFDLAMSNLDRLRKEKKDKESEKDGWHKNLADIQSKVAKCESEVASISADLTSEEEAFRVYTQDYSSKVDFVRERIDKLRLEKTPVGNGNDGDSTTATTTSLLSLPPAIRDDLDCICCYETMGKAIFQCTEGHLICIKCHQRLEQCPVCREQYTLPGIRNRMAESLASQLTKL